MNDKGGHLRPGLTLVTPKREIVMGAESEWSHIREALRGYLVKREGGAE